MNPTQAIIILKQGNRKYGMIINGTDNDEIQFIPGTKLNKKDNPEIEFIPMDEISSIDTLFK